MKVQLIFLLVNVVLNVDGQQKFRSKNGTEDISTDDGTNLFQGTGLTTSGVRIIPR